MLGGDTSISQSASGRGVVQRISIPDRVLGAFNYCAGFLPSPFNLVSIPDRVLVFRSEL